MVYLGVKSNLGVKLFQLSLNVISYLQDDYINEYK